MILGTVWICGELPLEVRLFISACPKQASASGGSGGGEQEFSAV
jgi:hypothetical protein